MPWPECRKVDERLRFVARCSKARRWRSFAGIRVSRKTGYKISPRYKRCGLEGSADRSRRPYRR